MSKPQRRPNLTEVKKMLQEAAFDPNKMGPMQIITEEGLENPGYLEIKVIEYMREAQVQRRALESGLKTKDSYDPVYEDMLLKATRILTLARAVNRRKKPKDATRVQAPRNTENGTGGDPASEVVRVAEEKGMVR